MGEVVFKEIEGFPSYLIGNNGSVFSKKSNRFLKPVMQKNGYKHIELSNEGGPKQFAVHRLVAMAFVPNPNNYPIINHKDQNKGNNVSNNLEWCTYKYNSNYADCQKRKAANINYFSEKQIANRKTFKNRNGKKTAQLTTSGELVAHFPSSMEAFRSTGINPSHIQECCRGKRRTAGGFVWSYKEEE